MNPSTRTALLSDLTATLTILAALPYELGEMANVLPPEWKKWVAIIGACATLGLRIVKRFQVRGEAAAKEIAVVALASELKASAEKEKP